MLWTALRTRMHVRPPVVLYGPRNWQRYMLRKSDHRRRQDLKTISLGSARLQQRSRSFFRYLVCARACIIWLRSECFEDVGQNKHVTHHTPHNSRHSSHARMTIKQHTSTRTHARTKHARARTHTQTNTNALPMRAALQAWVSEGPL